MLLGGGDFALERWGLCFGEVGGWVLGRLLFCFEGMLLCFGEVGALFWRGGRFGFGEIGGLVWGGCFFALGRLLLCFGEVGTLFLEYLGFCWGGSVSLLPIGRGCMQKGEMCQNDTSPLFAWVLLDIARY